MWLQRLLIVLALLTPPFLSAAPASTHPAGAPSSPSLVLLIPDEARGDEPAVTVWLDAAAEEGLQLTSIHDSEFVASESNYAGVILPDEIHKRADTRLIRALENYVASGGNLMLVFDAATLDAGGLYPLRTSRLSHLAGVDYAFYTALRGETIQRAPVLGTAQAMDELQIPPGKAVPFQGTTAGVAPDLTAAGPYDTIDTYTYGDVPYSSFVTRGHYDGEVLLRSIPGLVAGYRHAGRGGVLFVNLSLGYLARRTDALLLHAFLQDFGERIGLPSLAAVPDATGGLVLNWHLDSNAAQQPMQELGKIGFFEQGPYSFHITAGPDRDTAGDHLGLDVPHNPKIQEWIRSLLQRGNTIGDHGGWIHNYFGAHLNETDQSFRLYLELNTQALEAVAGKPIVEYSAPVGNHPKWVTAWLEQRGFVAYYFTGNTGMAPTHSYRDGTRSDHSIWSFPITNLGKAASLEDMHQAGMPGTEVANWLVSMSDFVVRHRVSRLIYAHPPGAEFYPDALRTWLDRTRELGREGRFRWYTMTSLAEFLNLRQQVHWNADVRPGGIWVITATHPRTLSHQAWFLPQSAFERPTIVKGTASVSEDKQNWIVVAGEGKGLIMTAKSLVAVLPRSPNAAALPQTARRAPRTGALPAGERDQKPRPSM